MAPWKLIDPRLTRKLDFQDSGSLKHRQILAACSPPHFGGGKNDVKTQVFGKIVKRLSD